MPIEGTPPESARALKASIRLSIGASTMVTPPGRDSSPNSPPSATASKAACPSMNVQRGDIALDDGAAASVERWIMVVLFVGRVSFHLKRRDPPLARKSGERLLVRR